MIKISLGDSQQEMVQVLVATTILPKCYRETELRTNTTIES